MTRLWWFNPQCEAENAARVAGYYTARDVTRALATDLDLLPVYLADAADAVWVQEAPARGHLDRLDTRGFGVATYTDAPLDHPDRQTWEPTPWGWSPDAALLAERLSTPVGEPVPESAWPMSRRACFAKTTWLTTLAELCHEMPPAVAPTMDDIGVVCRTLEETHRAVADLHHRGIDTAVIKAPFGTAGQNATRVARNVWPSGTSNWVRRIIDHQSEVLVEPWRDRTMDLSVLADVNASGRTRLLGVTRFVTDRRGQYLGTWLHGPAVAELAPFRAVMESTAERVGAALATRGHVGPFGVDAMVFELGRERGPKTRHLKPLVEVNPRFTMGHLALALAASMPDTPALWRLFGPTELRAATGAVALARSLQSAESWPTNDPTRAQRVLSMVVEDPVKRGLVAL